MKRASPSISPPPPSEDSSSNSRIPEEREKNEVVPKRPKMDIAERINKIASVLNRHAKEHENNRIKVQNKIGEVCSLLREAANNLEEHLNETLKQNYTEEESRIQESTRRLEELSNDNEEKPEHMSDDDKEKELDDIEDTLYGVQRYDLAVPQCEDLKKWASDMLGTEFKVNVGQSPSEEIFEGKIPRITGIEAVGPNEIHIGISFLEPEEEVAMYKVKGWNGVEYNIEMWNGEEGDDYEVRSGQIMGPSHNAYVEWRFRGGSECKVRGRAMWRGLFGDEYVSEWSDWVSFTIPSEHKNSGALESGVMWERREEGETYTVIDMTTNDVLYNGMKSYTMIPQSVQGHEILISGVKGDRRWEESRTVEEVPLEPENLLDDLRIFHYDKVICKYAPETIAIMVKTLEGDKSKIINLGGLDVISNTIRSHIGDIDVCLKGFEALGRIVIVDTTNQKITCETGWAEVIADAVRQHFDNVNVCKNGLIIIENIAFWSPDVERLLVKMGWVDLIKDVIKRHIDNVDICRKGLFTMDRVASWSPDSQKALADMGWIEVIKNVIKKYIDNADICQHGLITINKIVCENPDIIGFAGKNEWIELIGDVVKEHIVNDDICKAGFIAANNVVQKSSDIQKHSGNSEYIKLSINVIKQYIDDESLCQEGFSSLGEVICMSPDNQKLACDLRCIELVNNAIRQHVDNAELCKNGLDVINKIIVGNVPNQKVACDAGCIEMIGDTIRLHISNGDVCTEGLAAICRISFQNYDVQKQACELEFVDLLFDVIDRHEDDQDIVEEGCVCIERLLSSQENHAKWCTEEVMRKVEEYQTKYADSQLIRKCLACLKREEDPRVADAVQRGVCTKETTKCGMENCQRDKRNHFCVGCAAQQKCFKCVECQEVCVACCETCMRTKHSGHQMVEFFDIITYC